MFARIRAWSVGRDIAIGYAACVTASALVFAALPEATSDDLVLRCSTNLTNLHHDPLFVLVASAFVVSSTWSLWQLPLVVLVYAAAQRWVGRILTVTIAMAGNVGPSLLVAKVIGRGIATGRVDPAAARVPDVGMSYAAVCVAAFVVSRVPRRWRFWYVAGLVGYFAGPLLISPSFNALGHTAALVLGFGAASIAARVERSRRKVRSAPGTNTGADLT